MRRPQASLLTIMAMTGWLAFNLAMARAAFTREDYDTVVLTHCCGPMVLAAQVAAWLAT